jgi:hypothetical protein
MVPDGQEQPQRFLARRCATRPVDVPRINPDGCFGQLGANARERGACTGRASTSEQQKPRWWLRPSRAGPYWCRWTWHGPRGPRTVPAAREPRRARAWGWCTRPARRSRRGAQIGVGHDDEVGQTGSEFGDHRPLDQVGWPGGISPPGSHGVPSCARIESSLRGSLGASRSRPQEERPRDIESGHKEPSLGPPVSSFPADGQGDHSRSIATQVAA